MTLPGSDKPDDEDSGDDNAFGIRVVPMLRSGIVLGKISVLSAGEGIDGAHTLFRVVDISCIFDIVGRN